MPRKHYLLLILILPGCTFVNSPLNRPAVSAEYRIANNTRADVGGDVASPLSSPQEPGIQPSTSSANQISPSTNDGFFVGLSLSGGGSRSANSQRHACSNCSDWNCSSTWDTSLPSAAGRWAAAYFCSSGDGEGGWNPAEVQRRLTHSFATDMIIDLLEPWNMAALAFSNRSRSDLLAESLRDHLFTRHGHELTFADLRPDRPRLLINSTDLQSGRSFIFCNQSFDQINSNLSTYPLAYAVTASAAVPVILHQVTLVDYSTIFKQYRHLVDGGVVDNLGVASLLETYDAQMRSAEAAGKPDPYPNGVVLFVVDAQTSFDAHLSDKSDISLLESLRLRGIADDDRVDQSSKLRQRSRK